MAVDYQHIRAENERRYGTDIGRIGPMLLADRYAERTHFIYELLQNAEDALVRRGVRWNGRREVRFRLDGNTLLVSHCGDPFNERDVRGICGIAESPKDQADIGRFGIGFKSVYAFSDWPEVHSGEEDFLIEKFVWPAATAPIEREDDETVFALPLRPEDHAAVGEITSGLQRLGPRVLLFLRAIEEISWNVQGGPSGQYLRSSKADKIAKNARRVELLWQEDEETGPVDETWLVFDRPVQTEAGKTAGYVEVAFRLDQEGGKEVVRRVSESPLVVFFPTVLETHLGFLVQGPYRTTPSRDNVPKDDHWNKYLVAETGDLLVEALRALREMNLLDADALRVLPLDRSRFAEGGMFAPLFEAVRKAFRSEQLLPCFGGSYVAAPQARLARAQELRELFTPRQLAALFGKQGECAWLSETITQDRTPELRQYLMECLDVAEVTPEVILPRLGKPFLEAESDEWVVNLYEFLNDRRGLHRRLDDVPLVRLADGMHVKPKDASGKPRAFLPGDVETGFPTVKEAVCNTDAAREFLESLGVREPDPVDDVVLNILPKYRIEEGIVSDVEYASDIGRITMAFQTDSTSQRNRLVEALRESEVIKAVDAGEGSKMMAKPGAVYLATGRLKELFDGVGGILLVDDSYECLRGEDVRDLLLACGAARYLRPMPVKPDFTHQELQEMRRQAGLERCTWTSELSDHALSGLERLLETMAVTSPSMSSQKARLLWESLGELENRRGTGVFDGTYRWSYSHESKTTRFDAAFVRRLNQSAWVPGVDGSLQPPASVLFEETGWAENPFLFSKIHFKPRVVEQLAREAGIDPGLIAALKTYGITSEEELIARLGVEKEQLEDTEQETEGPSGQEPEDPGGERTGDAGIGGGNRGGGQGRSSGKAGEAGGRSGETGSRGGGRKAGGSGGRPFISYLGIHPDETSPDPDGIKHEQRLALENEAITFILACEPDLQRTATNNPGFDLTEVGLDEAPIRWVEVKAMTGSLADRAVGMSRAQFEEARRRGDRYWLYVVENAGEPAVRRVLRIQDPAGKARTFTFDHGWLCVADMDADSVEPKEDRKG